MSPVRAAAPTAESAAEALRRVRPRDALGRTLLRCLKRRLSDVVYRTMINDSVSSLAAAA